jgi:hypothetical protein
MNETITILQLSIVLLPILIGGTIAILKLTKWGRANQEALNTVSSGIEIAKNTTGEVRTVLDELTGAEEVKPLAVVKAWKAAHMKARGSS